MIERDPVRAPRVLLVDDDEEFAQAMTLFLRRAGYEVATTPSAPEALERARTSDVVLLDLSIEGGDGLEVCRQLKHDPSTRTIPIILMTCRTDATSRVEGFQCGADEYLTKPFVADELLARVGSALERKRLFDELASTNRELAHAALTDSLTGALNRRGLDDSFPSELERARRYGHDLSVVVLDLDDFKWLNDTHGHAAGDDALRATARTLRRRLRASDLLCRLGGDEFVAILPHTDIAQARSVALDLSDRVREFVMEDGQGRRVPIAISVGAASMRDTGTEDPEVLLAAADRALYEAKAHRGAGETAAAAFPPDAPDLPHAPAASRGRVLVVEDDDEFASILVGALSRARYTVLAVRDGAACLEEAGRADVILLDICLGAEDGLDVCRRLREMRSAEHVPVIFVTSRIDPASRVAAFQSGGDEYLTKPFSMDELLARVARALVVKKRSDSLRAETNRYLRLPLTGTGSGS